MRFAGETYEQIVNGFSWDLPPSFNIATACCDGWATAEPGRVALRRWVAGAATVDTSYGELQGLSRRLAAGLAELGATAGDRVAIILPQSLDTVVAHLAIYRLGLIAVPLARLFQPEALEFRLGRAGVSIVITDGDGAAKIRAIRDRLPLLRHVLVAGGPAGAGETALTSVMAGAAAPVADASTTPETPALIIFTSGTTGQPKGALHGHRVVIGHLPGLMTHHDFLPQPGDLAWTPADWAWAGGLLNILLPCLMLGVPVVYGGLDRFDAEQAFRAESKLKISVKTRCKYSLASPENLATIRRLVYP